jgi:hypothetical protein
MKGLLYTLNPEKNLKKNPKSLKKPENPKR